MDEMKIKISTKIMRNLISKIVSKTIYKKLGYRVDIQLNGLDANMNMNNGDVTVKLNAEANLKYDELIKIINSVNLD